jgi:hypothetical protein
VSYQKKTEAKTPGDKAKITVNVRVLQKNAKKKIHMAEVAIA